jgi:formylglycine-generating enzyme required for sulfatase activity
MCAARRGARRVNPKDGLTYLWIPPGTFTMGCSLGDSECESEGKPAHRVVPSNAIAFISGPGRF